MKLLKKLYAIWMKFARAIGWFNSRLLLFLIFYLILFPLSLLLKLFSKKLLQLDFVSKRVSCWEPREMKKPAKETYERQF